MTEKNAIVKSSDLILVTGSGGFIGSRVVKALLEFGFTNLRCLVRPSSNLNILCEVVKCQEGNKVQIVRGNLLSQQDCNEISKDAQIIYHLAAGRGEKSYPNAYLNSVVTTRNLLKGALQNTCLQRFVNVSSFTVYSNWNLKRGGVLDETCEVETAPLLRGEAYTYAKVKQEEIVVDYGSEFDIPYVILRPGVVYGPGNKGIHSRVGIDTFGIFIHLGGENRIPLTYVDNCADAIVLAGIRKGVDGEVFNIVDDQTPTSKEFLRMYKQNVNKFRSLYVPYRVFYLFCYLWERYSKWSGGQLPPVFNRKRCSAYWKRNRYSNEKVKRLLCWSPKVSQDEALSRYFAYQREVKGANV